MEFKEKAEALIIGVVIIVVAMTLLPTVFNAQTTVTQNKTYQNDSSLQPTLNLVNVVSLILVAAVIMIIVAMFFDERARKR